MHLKTDEPLLDQFSVLPARMKIYVGCTFLDVCLDHMAACCRWFPLILNIGLYFWFYPLGNPLNLQDMIVKSAGFVLYFIVRDHFL